MSVGFDDSALHVDLGDGRSLAVPLAWFPWLARLSPAERERYTIVGDGSGLWWDGPDEGLSVPALLGLPCE